MWRQLREILIITHRKSDQSRHFSNTRGVGDSCRDLSCRVYMLSDGMLSFGVGGNKWSAKYIPKKFPSGGHNARSGTDLSKEWLFSELQGSPR